MLPYFSLLIVITILFIIIAVLPIIICPIGIAIAIFILCYDELKDAKEEEKK